MNKLLITIAMLTSCVMSAVAGEIHVDKNKSLEEALFQAREWRRLNAPEATGGIHIYLGDNTYRLNKPLLLRPEDSGTAASPTIIHGGTISGAVSIKNWKKEGKLWVADAPRTGNKIIYSRQLWVNGHKALRSQQFAAGKMERMIDFNVADKTITIPTPKEDLSKETQLEMMVHQRWAIAILRVKEMKRVGKNTVVSFHEPESQLEFAHPWPQPVINGEKGNSSFCLMNAKVFLNEPGEWYQDYPSGKIYYYPLAGESIQKTTAEIPHLEQLIYMAGTEERPVTDIHFEGTTFCYAGWQRPSYEGHVTLQGGFRMLDAYKLQTPGLFHKAALENQAWIARPEAAISAVHAERLQFNKCSFTHLAATGVDLEGYVNNSIIQGNRFEDIGGTAIMVGYFGEQGFETHIPYLGKNICDNITIKENRVKDATNEDWGAVGIAAGYVSNINIVQNEVCDVNYSGICVGWGWTALKSGMHDNRIEGNYVHRYAKQLYDAGGIYTLSNQPGSFIINNRIEAPTKAPYATNDRGFCIYFDEATDGYTVENNWMPTESFGYNQPGPAMIIRNNGPQVKVKSEK